MICSSTYEQGVSCHACFNFSRLHSGSPTLHTGNSPSPTIDLRNKHAHLKFTVYGRKQASKHTHTPAQCSSASVGLAQARPNYIQTIYTLLVQLHKLLHEKEMKFSNLHFNCHTSRHSHDIHMTFIDKPSPTFCLYYKQQGMGWSPGHKGSYYSLFQWNQLGICMVCFKLFL